MRRRAAAAALGRRDIATSVSYPRQHDFTSLHISGSKEYSYHRRKTHPSSSQRNALRHTLLPRNCNWPSTEPARPRSFEQGSRMRAPTRACISVLSSALDEADPHARCAGIARSVRGLLCWQIPVATL